MESTEGHDDAVTRNRDVRIRGVLLFGFWLAVGAIATHLFIWGLLRVLARGERREDVRLSPMVAANLRRTPPEPRLEPAPLAPHLKMQAEEDAILTTYGWVDQTSGVVRLPIDRAMDLLVERGLPRAKPMAPTTTGLPATAPAAATASGARP